MANINSSAKRGVGGKFESAHSADKRPTGGNDGAAYVDPRAAATAAGEPGEPDARAKRRDPAPPTGGDDGAAKRGRPAKEKGASLDLSALAGIVGGVHEAIAFLRQEPHWNLNEADARKLGTALGNALRHMPIKAAQKTIDYATLGFVLFVIETPRVIRSAQLARAPKQAPRAPAQVFQFVPNPPSPASPPPSSAPQPPQPSTSQGTAMPAQDFAEGPADYGGEMGGEI